MGDDPFAYSGGLVIAMKGKDCVAIACDHRLLAGRAGVSENFTKVFEMAPHVYIGLPGELHGFVRDFVLIPYLKLIQQESCPEHAGLSSDTLTCAQRLKFRVNLYELREGRKLTPKTFGAMVQAFLYERRFGPFFVNPVIAGLNIDTMEPYVSVLDSIGAGEVNEPFGVGGTADNYALGLCESLWEPNLSPDDLSDTISQVLLQAIQHDCLSGVGGTVWVIQKEKVTVRKIKTRMD